MNILAWVGLIGIAYRFLPGTCPYKGGKNPDFDYHNPSTWIALASGFSLLFLALAEVGLFSISISFS